MGITRKLLISSAFCASSIGGVWLFSKDRRTVSAAWNSNAEPSIKWDHNWDKRDPKSLLKPPKKSDQANEDCIKENRYNEKLEKITSKATRHLFLIRHGQYILDGATDGDRFLTELGRVQAKLTGMRLKELGFPFKKIVASTMTRAVESAKILSICFPDVPMEHSEMLREGAPVPVEPPVGHWRPDAKKFYVDGPRIEAAFRQYFHRAEPDQTEDSHEIIMCHANVIRYFVCRALQLPPEAWLRFSLHHCSVTWVVIRPSGRVVVKTLGDCGHFPKDKMTLS